MPALNIFHQAGHFSQFNLARHQNQNRLSTGQTSPAPSDRGFRWIARPDVPNPVRSVPVCVENQAQSRTGQPELSES